jgi:hypothetical protein
LDTHKSGILAGDKFQINASLHSLMPSVDCFAGFWLHELDKRAIHKIPFIT